MEVVELDDAERGSANSFRRNTASIRWRLKTGYEKMTIKPSMITVIKTLTLRINFKPLTHWEFDYIVLL